MDYVLKDKKTREKVKSSLIVGDKVDLDYLLVAICVEEKKQCKEKIDKKKGIKV